MYGSQHGNGPLDPSVLRFILPVMIAGLVLFACVVLVVSPDSGFGAKSNNQKTPILTYIAGGFLATSVVAALAAPALSWALRAGRSDQTPGRRTTGPTPNRPTREVRGSHELCS